MLSFRLKHRKWKFFCESTKFMKKRDFVVTMWICDMWIVTVLHKNEWMKSVIGDLTPNLTSEQMHVICTLYCRRNHQVRHFVSAQEARTVFSQAFDVKSLSRSNHISSYNWITYMNSHTTSFGVPKKSTYSTLSNKRQCLLLINSRKKHRDSLIPSVTFIK